MTHGLVVDLPAPVEFYDALHAEVRRRSAGEADALADVDEGGPQAQVLIRAAQESFVDDWQQAMEAGSAVVATLLVDVLVRGPENTPAEHSTDETPTDVVTR